MKRYLIPLTALVIGVGMMGGDELGTRRKEIPPRSVRMLEQSALNGGELGAVRNYTLQGTNYLARFRYRTGAAFVPLTNPLGQPHYEAKANLYRVEASGNLTTIGEDIPCQYTENGCFEDGIEALLRGAGKSYKGGTNEVPWVLGPVMTNANLIYTNQIVFDPPGSVVFTLKCVGTNAQDYVDAAKYFKVMPDLVNLLATTGEICKVRGHAWKATPHFTLEWSEGRMEARECVVCGKYESRAMPAWPTP